VRLQIKELLWVIATFGAGRNILIGKVTWKDGVALGITALSGVAMAIGIKEIAIGVAA
jgi:hypothetical protein